VPGEVQQQRIGRGSTPQLYTIVTSLIHYRLQESICVLVVKCKFKQSRRSSCLRETECRLSRTDRRSTWNGRAFDVGDVMRPVTPTAAVIDVTFQKHNLAKQFSQLSQVRTHDQATLADDDALHQRQSVEAKDTNF